MATMQEIAELKAAQERELRAALVKEWKRPNEGGVPQLSKWPSVVSMTEDLGPLTTWSTTTLLLHSSHLQRAKNLGNRFGSCLGVLCNGLDPIKLGTYLLERGSLHDDSAKQDVASIICGHKSGRYQEFKVELFGPRATADDLEGRWDERRGEWTDGVDRVPIRAGIQSGVNAGGRPSHAPEVHALENASADKMRPRSDWDGKGMPITRYAQRFSNPGRGIQGCDKETGIPMPHGLFIHPSNPRAYNHDVAICLLMAAGSANQAQWRAALENIAPGTFTFTTHRPPRAPQAAMPPPPPRAGKTKMTDAQLAAREQMWHDGGTAREMVEAQAAVDAVEEMRL